MAISPPRIDLTNPSFFRSYVQLDIRNYIVELAISLLMDAGRDASAPACRVSPRLPCMTNPS